MALGVHAAFIVVAYGIALAVIVGLIAWVTLDYRRQCRTLADLERRGIVRRSAGVRSTPVEGTTPIEGTT